MTEATGVTSRVVNGHVGDGEAIAASNGDSLDGCVCDADIGDS